MFHNVLNTVVKTYVLSKAYFWSIFASTWFISFFMPIKGFLILMAMLVISDTISGMIAAKKRGEKLSSRGFYRTLEKVSVYFLSIIGGRGIHLVFELPEIGWLPPLPFVYLVAGSICFTEFLSLRENVKSITQVDILGGFKNAIAQIAPFFEIKKKEDN
jgi:phage-related holin